MERRIRLAAILLLVAVAACQPAAVQKPLNTAPHPANSSGAFAPPQPAQVSGSQRLQYAWSKAIDGVAMGGMIGGLYGAGGGLIIGLIAGLVTADAHFEAVHNQIQSEYQKHRDLEAAVEQELARQQDLENQIANAASSTAPTDEARPGAQPDAVVRSQGQLPWPRVPSTVNRQAAKNTGLAALNESAKTQARPRPLKNVDVRDVNGDGIPDIWIYYDPQKPAEIMRQEEASKGNGRVDTWSYFKDGQLVRREVDTSGKGRPDTAFHYVNDMIAREERDENGHGRMTYRATFENGRLAKVEKETGGHGRANLWIYYDAGKDGEIVVKEEEDLNGDGNVDLWSYYDNGRLVRRDLSIVGLEVLSQQEKIPVARSELRQLLPAGN